MAKITVNLPNVPKDKEVTIPNVGKFKNGHIYDTDRVKQDTVYGKELEVSASKQELYTKAKELDIAGRSDMTVDELHAAIEVAQSEGDN